MAKHVASCAMTDVTNLRTTTKSWISYKSL